MTEELELDLMIKFKVLNIAEYTTKYGDYYGLMFAGAEIATKELQEEIKKTQHLADVRCDQAVENYQKWHVTNREKIDLEIKVEELEKQIEKMKCCINDLVHLGEFNEHTDEEYFNYQVHEALNNAGQFIKEIKENE